MLYIGDSHGQEKNEAMLNWAKKNQVNIYLATQSACHSIIFQNNSVSSKCFKLKQFINNALLTDNSINTVIMNYSLATQVKQNLNYLIFIKPNLHYIILGDQPELVFPSYNCVRDFTLLAQNQYLQRLFMKHKCLLLNFKDADKEDKELVTLTNNYKKKNINISFIPLSQYYKTPEYQGKILFRDGHLNIYGIDYIANHTKAFDFKIGK